MARIFISNQTPILHAGVYKSPAFYEGLIDSLIENGNDVFHLVTNDILASPWNGTNKPYSARVKTHVHEKIKEFNPDVVIAFNNSCVEDIETLFDGPILLWDVDSVKYFNDKDVIRKNPNRYHYLGVSDYSVEDYTNVLSAPLNRIYKLRFATAVKAQNIQQIYNVSFIGSRFKMHGNLSAFLENNLEEGKKLVQFALTHNLAEVKSYLKQHGFDKTHGLVAEYVKDMRAGQDRVQVLSAIAPLGLSLFGDFKWKSIHDSSIEIYAGFDPSLVYSLAHNESIYNKSKVSISISHAQNVTAYPWRIVDIMASNGALVADRKLDLVNDFGKNVPLQLYDTPNEAYEITKKLLNDDNLRRDLVEASQKAIDDGGYRWHNRIKDIEEIVGMSLFVSKENGQYIRYAQLKDPLKKPLEKIASMIFRTPVEKKKLSILFNLSKKILPKKFSMYLKFLILRAHQNRTDRPLYKV